MVQGEAVFFLMKIACGSEGQEAEFGVVCVDIGDDVRRDLVVLIGLYAGEAKIVQSVGVVRFYLDVF